MVFRTAFAPLIDLFRSVVKRFTRPRSLDEAEDKRELYAKLYMTSSMILFSYVTYLVYKEEAKEGDNLDLKLKKFLKEGEEVRIVNFDGFKKKDDYIYIVGKGSKEDVVKNEISENLNSSQSEELK